jgi:hypothetical protein
MEKDRLLFLQNAFASDQACLVANLKSSNRIAHSGDKGEVNEEHFIDFLTSYLPNRYTVKKAMIIDCAGDVSDSIDIVVFDRQYTPTLLDNNKHRYVPAEAVYAVFECKPAINKEYLKYAADKIQSVRRLKRTSVEIVHAGGKYPPKEHFDILGGILALRVDWEDCLGESFQKNHKTFVGDERVDCGFAAEGASFDIFDDPDNFSYSFGPRDNSLAYFAFRLLWKLQSLATVPAVDWMAYANTLSK